MSIQRWMLFAYGLLLRFYPPAFRRRFAVEMLEVAEAAAPTEWPLIFGDTSLAIVRCWIEGTHSTAVLAEPDAYLALGESRPSASVLLHGLALSIMIIVGLCYVSYRWPTPCTGNRQIVTRVVAGNAVTPPPGPGQRGLGSNRRK